MAEKSHCHYCFEVLASSLSRPKKSPLSLSEIEQACHSLEAYKESTASTNGTNGTNGTTNGYTNGVSRPERPLFVTWNQMKGGGKQLRGCIGTFGDQPLEDGLKTYALTAYVFLLIP